MCDFTLFLAPTLYLFHHFQTVLSLTTIIPAKAREYLVIVASKDPPALSAPDHEN